MSIKLLNSNQSCLKDINLIYITNDFERCKIAQNCSIDTILVDLEYIGKHERQSGRNTLISAHSINDVHSVRKVCLDGRLMVRINPIGPWSNNEINEVISAGADILMLPFFKSVCEVKKFIDLVKNRAKICLLLETLEAVSIIDSILELGTISYVHIGLNDISIQRGSKYMFDFLADGGVEGVARSLILKGIKFGFGGIGKIGTLVPPAERILAEHYRIRSSGVILSRSFFDFDCKNSLEVFEHVLKREVAKIRLVETVLKEKDEDFFEINKTIVAKQIGELSSGNSNIDKKECDFCSEVQTLIGGNITSSLFPLKFGR
jgi:hypothetical protein